VFELKSKVYTTLFIIFFSSLNLFSQRLGTLRGIVTDSTNGEALVYANAVIKELKTGTSTNENGYFLFRSIPANKTYHLIISYIGYNSKKVTAVVRPNKLTEIRIKLSPSSYELQTIEKVGNRIPEKNATDIGLNRISIKELEAMPKGVETDIFRSLQYIAGVKSTGDISAKYYVRGGSGDQNLVLINGISVYSPFHVLGMFSIFDPDIIKNVEFYKGGFPAEYGGRLSSVLNIITKDGNKNNYSAKFSGSFLTGKALVEGPLPYGSFVVAGRKTYSNQILKKFLNNKNIPIDFYDVFFEANYSNPNFNKGTKFVINGFASQDNIIRESQFLEDYKWQNKLFGFTWYQVAQESPTFFNLGISISTFNGEVFPKLSNIRPEKNDVYDISLKSDFSYVFNNKDEIDFGIEIKDVKTKLLLTNKDGITADIGNAGTRFVSYIKYKFLRFDNFGVDIGTRINLAQLSEQKGDILEPRISFTYTVSPLLSIKGAWGIFQQDLITYSDEDDIITIFEPWLITPSYLAPAKSRHFIAGLTSHPFSNLKIQLETYYKKTNNLAIINDQKFTITDPDFISGSSESYGWEAVLTYNNNLFNFTASYTNAWTFKTVNNWTYYPKFDSRRALNLGLNLNIGKGWHASAMWIYGSGLPFTKIVGYYDKYYVSNIYFNQNYFDSTNPYTLLGDKNLGRLPDYHRLDISLSKKIKLDFANLEIAFSIINAYNRKNILFFKRQTGERVYMLPFLPTATIKLEL